MNASRWLDRVLGTLGLVLLGASAVLLLLFSTLQSLFPGLSVSTLLGLVVTALTMLGADFYRVMFPKRSRATANIDNTTIIEGVLKVTADEKHFDVVRILATTTENILPAIRDTKSRIQDCRVVLAYFDTSSAAVPKASVLAAKTDNMVPAWVDFALSGSIDKLDLRRTTNVPDAYVIMFDAKAVVFGLYYPTDYSSRVVDFTDAMTADDSTPDGKLMIGKFTEQFDKIFAAQKAYSQVEGRVAVLLPSD